MTNTATTEKYKDKKRYWWIGSALLPLTVLTGLIPAWQTQNPHWLWLPLILTYVIVPLADVIFGEDTNNPPEEVVPELEEKHYYRIITYFSVLSIYISFIAMVVYLSTHQLSWDTYLVLILNCGLMGGQSINIAHELGHKRTKIERFLARMALTPSGYGHFCIDHNRGHHKDVSTPEDPASSRLGENIYRFAIREIPGVFKRAWHAEATLLKRKGLKVISYDNEILRNWSGTVLFFCLLVLAFGIKILPFLLLQAAWGYFQLTSANYIEHYGLLRQKKDNGHYEICKPHHSWNSNHIVSNLALFHLERHSDHHAYPSRRYQSLRHFDNTPQLPAGYFAMFVLSYFPALWRAVMDKRVLMLVNNDLEKINVCPSKKAHYAQWIDNERNRLKEASQG